MPIPQVEPALGGVDIATQPQHQPAVGGINIAPQPTMPIPVEPALGGVDIATQPQQQPAVGGGRPKTPPPQFVPAAGGAAPQPKPPPPVFDDPDPTIGGISGQDWGSAYLVLGFPMPYMVPGLADPRPAMGGAMGNLGFVIVSTNLGQLPGIPLGNLNEVRVQMQQQVAQCQQNSSMNTLLEERKQTTEAIAAAVGAEEAPVAAVGAEEARQALQGKLMLAGTCFGLHR